MEGPAVMPRLLKILCTCLIAASVATLPATAQADRHIRGPHFIAAVPGGWHVKEEHTGGWRTYRVSSPGSRLGSPRGSMVVVVSVIGTRQLSRKMKRKLPRNPARLVELATTIPRGATQLSTLVSPLATDMAGEIAGFVSVQYVYRNTLVLQDQYVVQYRGRVYAAQLAADSNIGPLGRSALATILGSWHWR
jgi:hypothetical protein